MKLYNCRLEFSEKIQAENEDEAMEKFLEVLDSLSSGWEEDNTYIDEVNKLDIENEVIEND